MSWHRIGRLDVVLVSFEKDLVVYLTLRDGFSGWRGEKKETAVIYSLWSTLQKP